MGEPDYPESSIPNWIEFQDDFEDFYYLERGRKKGSVMIIESDEEEIGCLCYACFHLKPNTAELDIWLKEYSISSLAAEAAVEYYQEVNGDMDKLKLSYEWAWMRTKFLDGK